jgi:hypothetical protein
VLPCVTNTAVTAAAAATATNAGMKRGLLLGLEAALPRNVALGEPLKKLLSPKPSFLRPSLEVPHTGHTNGHSNGHSNGQVESHLVSSPTWPKRGAALPSTNHNLQRNA